MLRNYGIQGVLNKVKGIILADLKTILIKKEELERTIIQIMTEEFNVSDIPVAINMDFGHTDPKWILP